MNSKKLIIYEYKTLFDILYEIKENLDYEIIKVDANNPQNIEKDTKQDFLIISKNKKENSNNRIILENLPSRIGKIIELINIQFLKNKFNLQSNIKIGSYDLNLNSRQIIKKKMKLDLTERETNLIIYLNKSNLPVKIDELQTPPDFFVGKTGTSNFLKILVFFGDTPMESHFKNKGKHNF